MRKKKDGLTWKSTGFRATNDKKFSHLSLFFFLYFHRLRCIAYRKVHQSTLLYGYISPFVAFEMINLLCVLESRRELYYFQKPSTTMKTCVRKFWLHFWMIDSSLWSNNFRAIVSTNLRNIREDWLFKLNVQNGRYTFLW